MSAAQAVVAVDQCTTSTRVAVLGADGGEEAVRERTGLPLTASLSASEIRWLRDEVPEARELSRAGRLRVGTMDAWLVWNVTGGVHATDVTNASRTLLMDLATGDWSAEMLELFGLEADRWEAMAPRIRPSIGRFGEAAGLGHEDRRWEPAMEPAERERLLARWGRAVEASLGWA